MKKIFLLAIVLGVSSCSMINTPSENRKALQHVLFEGMGKADLLKRLGDPYKIDHLSAQEELVYYETDMLAATFCLQYTSIRLLNAKVKEWGQQVCKDPSLPLIDPKAELNNHLRQ